MVFSLYIISPDVGFIIPVSILSNVDFPAPFGPSNPYIEFFGTSKDISFIYFLFFIAFYLNFLSVSYIS